MASKSEQDCESKVITIPEQLDSGRVAPRSAIRLMRHKLRVTLEDFDSEQIKGAVRWNDQICVATDRFLAFYRDARYNKAANFKHVGDTALPPEIKHVVAIATGLKYYLHILSDWIWTLSTDQTLRRWIEAPNVSSISVSEDGTVLLSGNNALAMYNEDGTILRKFSLPHDYEDMRICQAVLTSANWIFVSICGLRNSRVLLMSEEGIVQCMYNSSTWNTQPTGDTSVHTNCTIHNQFIAVGKGGRLFVAETYPGNSMSSCQICKEKILVLGTHLQPNQIILPDRRTQLKNCSSICYSEEQLIVTCMKVKHANDPDSKGLNEVHSQVINVFDVENESEDDSESEEESEGKEESEREDKSESDDEGETEK